MVIINVTLSSCRCSCSDNSSCALPEESIVVVKDIFVDNNIYSKNEGDLEKCLHDVVKSSAKNELKELFRCNTTVQCTCNSIS